jgi:hypothetical protein
LLFDFSVFSVRYFPWLLFFIRSHCLNRCLSTSVKLLLG